MRMPWRRKQKEVVIPSAATAAMSALAMPLPASEETGVIHLQGVECSYPGSDEPAISNFNLLVRPGEFVSILGRSGAGKTTALRVVAGFEQVSSGYVRVGGQLVGSSFVHIPPDERRIGLVFQDYALFPHLSVAKNVEFGLNDLPADERRSRIAPVLKMVGMSGYESRYVHELSGGQQQRVAVARAIAAEPALVLADEPTANLDSETALALLKLMEKLNREHETTFLFSTHDPRVMKRAHRIIHLVDGRVDRDEPQVHDG